MKKTVKDVLMEFMQNNNYTWYRKVSLYSVAEDWSPETVGRSLRELAEDGFLEKGEYLGKRTRRGLARYKLTEKVYAS